MARKETVTVSSVEPPLNLEKTSCDSIEFRNIQNAYLPNERITLEYQISEDYHVTSVDRVILARLPWRNPKSSGSCQWSAGSPRASEGSVELTICMPPINKKWKKNEYQFLYLGKDNKIQGKSTKFLIKEIVEISAVDSQMILATTAELKHRSKSVRAKEMAQSQRDFSTGGSKSSIVKVRPGFMKADHADNTTSTVRELIRKYNGDSSCSDKLEEDTNVVVREASECDTLKALTDKKPTVSTKLTSSEELLFIMQLVSANIFMINDCLNYVTGKLISPHKRRFIEVDQLEGLVPISRRSSIDPITSAAEREHDSLKPVTPPLDQETSNLCSSGLTSLAHHQRSRIVVTGSRVTGKPNSRSDSEPRSFLRRAKRYAKGVLTDITSGTRTTCLTSCFKNYWTSD